MATLATVLNQDQRQSQWSPQQIKTKW